MVMVEVRQFPHGRISHKLLNVAVEAVRAYPKMTVFMFLCCLLIAGEWALTGNFL